MPASGQSSGEGWGNTGERLVAEVVAAVRQPVVGLIILFLFLNFTNVLTSCHVVTGLFGHCGPD